MKLIGVNCTELIDNDLYKTIQQVVDCGYTSCELFLQIVPFIIDGELCDHFVKYAKDVMQKFDINYTAHIGAGLDLRSVSDFEAHKKVLFSSIELCSLLEIKVLTVHFEEKSKIAWIEKRFNETYKEANSFAKEKNVMMLMENIEVENFDYVLDCIEYINDDNFKMTLDVGHLFLSCNYFGQNFNECLNKALPYIKNVHLNDNTGKFMPMRLEDFLRYKMVPMLYRTTFGLGDIHLPPYFGKIPFDEIFEKLKSIEDIIYTCEYERKSYMQFDSMIFKTVNEKING